MEFTIHNLFISPTYFVKLVNVNRLTFTYQLVLSLDLKLNCVKIVLSQQPYQLTVQVYLKQFASTVQNLLIQCMAKTQQIVGPLIYESSHRLGLLSIVQFVYLHDFKDASEPLSNITQQNNALKEKKSHTTTTDITPFNVTATFKSKNIEKPFQGQMSTQQPS